MDQSDDEFLPGPALTVDQNGGVEWRNTCRQFEHVLHRLAAGDEMLRRRVTVDAVAQQVQLTLTAFQETLAPVQFLETFAHRLVETLHFVSDARCLKIGADDVEISAPTLSVAADSRTMLCALSHARRLAKIDLLSHARARETAGVSDQGPTHRRRGFPIVVHVLFGHV